MTAAEIILLILSIFAIIVCLLQSGKSDGASGAITGGGLNVFVKTKERGSELIISYLTLGFGIIFLFLALLSTSLTEAPAESTDDTTTTTIALLINYLTTIF